MIVDYIKSLHNNSQKKKMKKELSENFDEIMHRKTN